MTRRQQIRKTLPDPKRVFDSAWAFAQAAQSMVPKGKALVIPHAANAALSTELFLKCLAILERGKYPSDPRIAHDLKKLFEFLPSESQAAIRLNAAPCSNALPMLSRHR
jgi:hypothetical protein